MLPGAQGGFDVVCANVANALRKIQNKSSVGLVANRGNAAPIDDIRWVHQTTGRFPETSICEISVLDDRMSARGNIRPVTGEAKLPVVGSGVFCFVSLLMVLCFTYCDHLLNTSRLQERSPHILETNYVAARLPHPHQALGLYQ